MLLNYTVHTQKSYHDFWENLEQSCFSVEKIITLDERLSDTAESVRDVELSLRLKKSYRSVISPTTLSADWPVSYVIIVGYVCVRPLLPNYYASISREFQFYSTPAVRYVH